MNITLKLVSITMLASFLFPWLYANEDVVNSDELASQNSTSNERFTNNLTKLEEFIPDLVGVSAVWESYEVPKLFETVLSPIGEVFGNDVDSMISASSSLQENTPADQLDMLHDVLEDTVKIIVLQISMFQDLKSEMHHQADSLTMIENEWDPEWGEAPSYAEKYTSCTSTLINEEQKDTQGVLTRLTSHMRIEADFFAKASTNAETDFSFKVTQSIAEIYENVEASFTDFLKRFPRSVSDCLNTIDFDAYMSILENERENEE